MNPFAVVKQPEINVEALRALENQAMEALKRRPRRGVLGDLKRFTIAATRLRARLEMLEATREVEEASLFDGVAQQVTPNPAPEPATAAAAPAPTPTAPRQRKPRKAA